MNFDYTIKYKAENAYENPVSEAFWQYMVTPENNLSQELISTRYSTSENARIEESINGFGFSTARIHCKKPFSNIEFAAEFKLVKQEVNPFAFEPSENLKEDNDVLNSLSFRVDFDEFLKATMLTKLDKNQSLLFQFQKDLSVFENLQALSIWMHQFIMFKTNVTDTNTTLAEIIKNKQGVCQDYTHLFCALARANKIPARYVSGYLHQGEGYFGDSQMHAWSEAYVPNIGWIGFDTTNNILANHNHIKVSHGKDYKDCAPLKGIIYSKGENFTKYTVEVSHQQ